MSKSSIPSVVSGARLGPRLRKIDTAQWVTPVHFTPETIGSWSGSSKSLKQRRRSRAESEVSCEESARLTEDAGGGSEGSLVDLELPPPPDGGYGWVITFASFMCNLIVDGIAYTFGIFLPEFVKYFDEGKGKVAWVGSLLSGMYLVVGPLVSAMCNKFGCRAVCISGAIISATAFILSTFCKSVVSLMIIYGVIGGIGFGMIYLPAVVAVGYYFETKRSLATGIAVCGSGVGTFSFAPLAKLLLDAYGWRGSNLILAGIILNCVIFGALMRPLKYPKASKMVKPLLQRMAEEKRFQMERGSIAGSFFTVQLPDGTWEKRMKVPINYDPGVHSSFNLDQLASGLTPVPTMATLPTIPTLPTISEVKHSESSSSESQNNENKHRKPTNVDNDAQRLDTYPSATPAGVMPRNSSSPAFTTHHQGLPKNGSVPTFDRMRKTSTSERFKPSLAAIKSSSKGSMSSNGDVRRKMRLRLSNSSISRNNNADGENDSVYNSKMSISTQRESSRIVRPMSRKDIFYSASVVNLPEYQSQKSLTNYRNSVMSLTANQNRAEIDSLDENDLCACIDCPPSFQSALSSMMDLSLIKNPVFLMIGISNVFGFCGLYVPFVYLVDAAVQNGVEPASASYLISIIGITNTVGRVFCGWVADYPWMNSLLLNNVCLVISTFAVGFTPLCSSYSSYITVAVLFGIAISGYISLTSIILVDLLGLDKLTNAFGLLILFRGAAAIIGSPLAGFVYDMTNSYSASFYMAGVFFAISAITSFVAPLMKRFSEPEPTGYMPTLTPIDEENNDFDPDDTPITMGKQHTLNGGHVPKITHTAASPMSSDAPSKVDTEDDPGTEMKVLNEVNQIESVL